MSLLVRVIWENAILDSVRGMRMNIVITQLIIPLFENLFYKHDP